MVHTLVTIIRFNQYNPFLSIAISVTARTDIVANLTCSDIEVNLRGFARSSTWIRPLSAQTKCPTTTIQLQKQHNNNDNEEEEEKEEQEEEQEEEEEEEEEMEE